VAGTVDCIADYDGKRSVIDFKTASKIKTKESIDHYFMQTAAYAVMFEERTGIPVNQLVIIMGCDESTRALVFIEKRDNWIQKFIDLRHDYYKLKGR
jgi:genome maintenance exonuclease 1